MIHPMHGVRVVDAENGSRIHPIYRNWWTENKKIAYSLGVLVARGGPSLRVYDSRSTTNGIPNWPRHYGVTGYGISISCGTQEELWRTLVDIGIGFEMGKRVQA